MTRPRAVCERGGCEERAIASAYAWLLCLACYRELGFNSPRLLGGRPPAYSGTSVTRSGEGGR